MIPPVCLRRLNNKDYSVGCKTKMVFREVKEQNKTIMWYKDGLDPQSASFQ